MKEILKTFLDVTCKYGFFTREKNQILLGPMAQLLSNNIRREWLNDSVNESDCNVLRIEGNANTTWQEDCFPSFHQQLQHVNGKLPFGLVFTSTDIPFVGNGRANESFSIVQPKTNVYRCIRFVDPKRSPQYFYRLQRSRNIWWRKFARHPEIFQINEVEGDKENEAVEIVAKSPLIEEAVETIYSHGSGPLEGYGSKFEIKSGRKRVLPHVIESVCLEVPATVAYMCDAFQSSQSRTILRFHHRLTPYKAAVVVEHEGRALEEAKLLADFLNLSLRKAGLQTFANSDKPDESVETQFSKHDQLGIPYTLVIKGNTLVNGIAGLRSRDTTLQEQVHLSRITSYMKQLFKN